MGRHYCLLQFPFSITSCNNNSIDVKWASERAVATSRANAWNTGLYAGSPVTQKRKKKVISISAEFNIYGALNEDLEMAVHIR